MILRIFQVIAFILLSMFLCFCGGMFLGSLLVSADNGFASAPAALGYGVAGLFTGLAGGIIFSRILKHSRLRNVLIILSILSLVLIAWLVYRIK